MDHKPPTPHLEQPEETCGNCVGWGAKDAEVMRAPSLRIGQPTEEPIDRPVIRMVNRMSDRPQRLAVNVQVETPRGFSCALHRRFEDCSFD